jgi:hypothetical protein
MVDISLRKQTSDDRKWDAIREFYAPRKPADSVDTIFGVYDYAASFIGPDTPIVYLEFGVASGASIRAISALFRNPLSRFIGFDSFVGLPEAWLMHEPGAFSTGGIPPRVDDDRVEFVPGWFQNTVPARLTALGKPTVPVLIHYDADLYSSTTFLLSTVWHHIPEYFFMMDDFIQEDAIALYDISKSHPIDVKLFAERLGGGGHPNQVFGSIRRIPFVLPT